MNVTRTLTHEVRPDGSFTELESELPNSVELGQDSKGNILVKSVKVYHADAEEAAKRALVVMDFCLKQIASGNPIGTKEGRSHEQQDQLSRAT